MYQATRCTQGQPWTNVVGEISTYCISLVSSLDHIPCLIQIPKREVGLHILRAKSTTKSIVTAVSRAIEGLIPVQVIPIEETRDFGVQLTIGQEDTGELPITRCAFSKDILLGCRVLLVVGLNTCIGIVSEGPVGIKSSLHPQLGITLILIIWVIAVVIVPLLPTELVVIHCSDLVMLGETTLGEALAHREGKASYPIRSTTSIALGGDDDDTITSTGSIEQRHP